MSDMNSYTQEHSMESFFGRVNYDFDNKYYLSASIRSDESSKFHPDHRRGTFGLSEVLEINTGRVFERCGMVV